MTQYQSVLLISTAVCLASAPASSGSEPTGDPSVVLETPNLVAFWTFGEPAGQSRRSLAPGDDYPLQEVGGPIERKKGGPYSGYAAYFDGTQYMKIPYAETGRLNIGGAGALVSMFAVVCLTNLEKSRTIAGMWCEGQGAHYDSGTRQYAVLMNMPTYGGPR
jgi:hypothetical protein